jgi:bacteriocin-like protein
VERKNDMKLTSELKEKVEKTESKEEAKKTIEAAGMILSDDELDQVSGGAGFYPDEEVVHT